MWRDAVTRAFACALVMLLLRNTFVHCCGPGRGGARRRSTRKLMPLIFKEHVPNVYENTLGASGLTEGPITRDSARFQELVPNYNPDIIFRDEEGTGADRLMTERCKERLDSLAISVMNQWPGVRLRVKEGWEDDVTRHNPDSLHFEGRAVDIATSDSDRSKYGMLGRLAVEAGFDWVYYEARSHVHCSCKSEAPALNRLGGCFPGSSVVRTPEGPKPVSTVVPGDLVQVMAPSGTTIFSHVLMMIHSNSKSRANFLRIHTKAGRKLNITPSHLLMIVKQDENPHRRPLNETRALVKSIFAGQIRMGDQLVVQNAEESLLLDEIVGLTSAELDGVFAPLTNEGNIIVDDTVVSCYANIDSQSLAHWSFWPVRIYYRIKGMVVNVLESIGLMRTKSYLKADFPASNHQNSTKEEVLLQSHSTNSHDVISNSTSRAATNIHTAGGKRKQGMQKAPSNAPNDHPRDQWSFNQGMNQNEPKTKPREVLLNPDVADASIHWYARCLYAVARLVLPKTWIVS